MFILKVPFSISVVIKTFALAKKKIPATVWYLVIAKSYIYSTKQELWGPNGEVLISSVVLWYMFNSLRKNIHDVQILTVIKSDSINIYSNPTGCVMHFKVEPWLKVCSLSSRNIWFYDDMRDKQTYFSQLDKGIVCKHLCRSMQKVRMTTHSAKQNFLPFNSGDSHWDH